MQILRGRTTGIHSLVVSLDSRYIAVGGVSVCHVWDVHDPKSKPRSVVPDNNFISNMQFIKSNDLIVLIGGQWRCYSVAAGYAEWFDFPVVANLPCIFHPTGTLLLTGR